MTVYVRPSKSHIFSNSRAVWRKTSTTFLVRAVLIGLILTVVVTQGVTSSHVFLDEDTN